MVNSTQKYNIGPSYDQNVSDEMKNTVINETNEKIISFTEKLVDNAEW